MKHLLTGLKGSRIERRLNTLLLMSIIGILACASTSHEQVATATARIVLTVIPPPGILFTLANPTKNISRLNWANDHEMTFQRPSNVAVFLNSSVGRKILDRGHIGQGSTNTLTLKDLDGVTKVEVVYLGS